MSPIIDDVYLATSAPAATAHWKVRESYLPPAVELKGTKSTERSYDDAAELHGKSKRARTPLSRRLAKSILVAVFVLGIFLVGRTAAISSFHLHNFNEPSTVGRLTIENNALTLANPPSEAIRNSFSQTYGDGTNQILVLAVQSKAPTTWTDAEKQAVLSQVHGTLDGSTTSSTDLGAGVTMNCSTADKNSGSGFVSVCFWTDYDIRAAVVDMASSSPAQAATYAVQVKDAIEQ